MDRLEAMSVLVAAVETGSFSAAGRKLGMPLPTVSRKVSELEARLQTRLLVRTTRKLALTDAGAAYLAAARRILDLVDDAETLAAGEYSTPKGDLMLTAPIAFGRLHVLPMVHAFLDQFPQIQVRANSDGPDRESGGRSYRHGGAHRRPGRQQHDCYPCRLCAARDLRQPRLFRRSWRAENPGGSRPSHLCQLLDLASNPVWAFPKRAGRRAEAVTVPSRLNVNTAEAAGDAAMAGIGLTRALSYQVAAAVAQGKLRIILADFEPEPAPVHLVHAAQGLLPRKMRSFLDFAAPRLPAPCRRSIAARWPCRGGPVPPGNARQDTPDKESGSVLDQAKHGIVPIFASVIRRFDFESFVVRVN